MTIQLPITFETLLMLVDQLAPEQQQDLLLHLKESQGPRLKPGSDEWIAEFEALIIHTSISDEMSFNRADWYDDDEG